MARHSVWEIVFLMLVLKIPIVYLGFVVVGLFYIWKKGILDWSSDKADL